MDLCWCSALRICLHNNAVLFYEWWTCHDKDILMYNGSVDTKLKAVCNALLSLKMKCCYNRSC